MITLKPEAQRVLNNEDLGVLGIFPAMSATGGIQTSGRVAWEGVTEKLRAGAENSFLFCYGEQDELNGWIKNGLGVHATSKLNAVVTALKTRRTARCMLIWHIGLLKLLPFLRADKSRVVLFLHGIEAWQRQDPVGRLLLGRVDLFLSNSDYTWQRFIERHPEQRQAAHRTVHLGMSSSLNESAPRPDAKPAALMISRLSRDEDYKGHREMISAWSEVLRREPEAELWIIGDGDLRAELEKLTVERGVSQSVRFCGQVSETEKQELLRRCRCLALPSRGEGFGLVYLEAMRLGRPCLVSTSDAGREVVNPPEAGLAVDLDNQHELSEAVCELLAVGPRWDQWSLQAQSRYENYFTAQLFHERLVAALFTET